jgi:D-beta-D-heptose 7-phosphate kinase/D-beta-D-heptose 1-phosphate adenosyltransferase
MKTSRERLVHLVKALRGRRMGVVGDLMLDRYIWGRAGRLSPEAPVPVVEFVEEEGVAGGAGNVAGNLAALGARVTLYGVVGPDEFAPLLMRCLRQRGISEKGILVDASRKTTVKTRIVAGHQHVVRVDRETRVPLARELEERLIRSVIAGLRSMQALILSDYDKGVVTDELSRRVLGACDRLGRPSFVKPKWSRQAQYPKVTTIVLNRAEASFLVSSLLEDEDAIEEAGHKLLAHFGCSALIITRGEQGMNVFEPEAKSFHVPASSQDLPHGKLGLDRRAGGRQVFDVTGAGDTVLATLALAVSAGATLREAAVLANAAAGIVVGKLGTATVSAAELLATLRDLS